MIRVVTNDQIIVDTDIRNIEPPIRGSVPDSIFTLLAGLQNKSGPIEIHPLGDRRPDFRNIRIKELP
jgi:hypothetical protein